jgi:hypothetical protein
MKKALCLIMVIFFAASLSLVGCGAKKEVSAQAAIEAAKTMQTLKEKADYLIAQANAFYSSKQFQDAVVASQYVLQYLDKESQAAKDLLQKAKAALTAQAQKAVSGMQKKITDLGAK